MTPGDPDADPPSEDVLYPLADRRPAIPSTKVINTKNAKFLYNPPPADNPGGAEFVSGNYTPNRADVLEQEDFELTKGNWVETAHEEITKKLNQLRRIIDLDNADASAGDRQFANDQRQRLFDEIQAEFRKVFGPGDDANDTGVLSTSPTNDSAAWSAHSDYPVTGAGVAQDAGVLNEIQDALAALADGDAFAAALDDGGLFADAKAAGIEAGHFTAANYPSASAIFGRARGKLRMSADATDFTRFGGWNHQVSEYAAAALEAQNYDRGDRGQEFGSFAYSPLDPTAEYAANSRLYPAQTADVTATYAGRTSAAQGDTFYTGNVEAKVYWNSNVVTDSTVRLTITELEDTVNGDPLEFGYARDGFDTAGTVEVESLSWDAAVKNDGTVTFSSSADVTVKVDSLSGDPQYRPLPGGGTLLAAHPQHYNVGNNDEFWYQRTDQSGSNDYAYATAAGGDFGALSFGGVDNTVRSNTNTAFVTSGTDYEAEKGVFEAGQMADSLAFPTYLVEGPNVKQNAGAGLGATASRGSTILLFADGSTRHLDRWSAVEVSNDRGLIGAADEDGDIVAPRANYDIGGSPGTVLPDELLFNDLGQSWSKDFSHADVPGTGAPEGMTPAQLAVAYFGANRDMVNILASDGDARNSKVEGMFVGQDQDGPLGIIGTWELTGGAFGIGDSTQDVRGAFGADIQP